MSDIFSPVRLGDIELRNRVVMAPMTRNRAGPGDEPTADTVEYYRQRAGAGLIVTEGVHPSRHGKGYYRTPGVHTPEQVEGWRKVAEAVHGEGGAVVMQLMHCGRASVRANKADDAETVAPSAIRCTADIPGPDGVPQPCETPRALETDEIAGVIAEYRQAALNAIEAGCDGVELHCSSGYLPMQFLCSGSNQRTDRYGGSAENRIRFVVETLQALSEAVGASRVGYRICPGNPYNDMHDDDWAGTFGALLRATDGMGLAYVHLIDRPTPELDTLALVKDNWTGPLIVNDSLNFEKGQALLTAGKADAVSYGRPFISNPDLVERFRRGAPLARQDRSTFYTGEARGYIDYPTLEEEG